MPRSFMHEFTHDGGLGKNATDKKTACNAVTSGTEPCNHNMNRRFVHRSFLPTHHVQITVIPKATSILNITSQPSVFFLHDELSAAGSFEGTSKCNVFFI